MFIMQLGSSNSVPWKITSALKSDKLNVARGGGIQTDIPMCPLDRGNRILRSIIRDQWIPRQSNME